MMKSKLTPLVLLIPAVVLAQSNTQNQIPAPQPLLMQGVPANPVDVANSVKAAEALKNAQKTSKEIKSKLPSNGEVGNTGNGSCSNTSSECYYTGNSQSNSSTSRYGY
jgi:hypothetical protein